ncbi:RNA dependent RNA polymerase-domain-containing protein, partial [Endogone sp. FLAS-F59071]
MAVRVFNIPYEITKAELVTALEPFGAVSECRLEMNRLRPRKNLGRATVVFQQAEHVQQLMERPPTLNDRLLRISPSRQPSVTSRTTPDDWEIENFAIGNWVECPAPRPNQSAWTYEKHWELELNEAQPPHLKIKQSIAVVNLCFPPKDLPKKTDEAYLDIFSLSFASFTSCQNLAYSLDVSFHDLMDKPRSRGVVIDDKTTRGKIVIYVSLQRPPKIFRERTEWENMFTLPTEGEDELIRTIDPTSSCIFDGRHMVWQITIKSQTDDQNIMKALSLLSKHRLVHSPPRTVKVKVQSPTIPLPLVEDSFFLTFPYNVGFKIHSLISANKLYHSEVHEPEFLEALTEVVETGDTLLACQVLDYLSSLDWQPGNAQSLRPYRRFAELLVGDVFLPAFNPGDSYFTDSTEKYVYIYHATVTPTKVWIEGPMIEPSNRILRQYRQHIDRFLRVTFGEENYEPLWTRRGTSELLQKRVRRVLDDGIVIAGRKHEFLAFGSSQLKDHSCWFFASFDGCTASQIRNWMGDFSEIKSPALYGARMGQCFTATTGTFKVPDSQVIRIDDIEVERMGKKYCFTDGIGKISEAFAKKAIDMAKLRVSPNNLPSVYQMRYGGCK